MRSSAPMPRRWGGCARLPFDLMTAGPPAQQTRELDCLGKACPVPVIELAKAMADMAAGEVIVVRSDDPGAKVDIPVWCRMKGQELLATEEADAELRFTVRKAR